jgi:hypothetical protein
MYVRHSVHIQHPFERCAEGLLRSPREWFPRLAGEAIASVGPKLAGVPIRKRVKVDIGEPVKAGSWLEIPVSWEPTSAGRFFPDMRGKVELAPVDPQQTRLSVSCTYEPPLGEVGAGLDETVMYRVAEGTMKELAESIAARLEKLLAEGSPKAKKTAR